MAIIEFSVRGHPAPWSSNEWDWRRAVADAAKQVSLDSAGQSPIPQAHFAVSIVFKFKPGRIERADLDNLAKPVLDTLFLPYRPQVKDMAITGALFHIDDSAVYALNLTKRLVATGDEEGIDITVAWELEAE